MRILIGTDTYAPHVNGAARFTERLAYGLLARGHEVNVVAPGTRHVTESAEVKGLVVHRVKSNYYWSIENFRWCTPWASSKAVEKIVDDFAPDVIHIQNHFIIGRSAAHQAVERGIGLVATNHFMPDNGLEYFHLPGPLERAAARAIFWDMSRVYGQAQVLTAPTPRAIGILERRAGLHGGLAVSCGIDSPIYAAAALAAPEHDVPVILYVGRLDQEKRVNELVSAVAMLPRDLPYRVEIIGIGSHREEWRKLAASLGVADTVMFRGYVEEDELVAAYGGCDIFCIPGVAELQSLVTLEAMSAGKPVVAADAMALPHLVHPGENGWLYTPGDIAGLRDHLERLLRDPEERRRMGAASQQIVVKHSIEDTLGKFETLYERAIAAAASR